ncbi:MAG: thiamine-phosphate kinase [Pseudomonadota bacterium]
MNEFEIIRHFFDDPYGDARIAIGDDAAVIEPPANVPLSIAVDTLIEGRHFPKDTHAEDIGYRALAVNLSDLAAMAAMPKFYTLALTFPEFDQRWLADFSGAMHALAAEFGMQLIGGDTTRGDLSVTVQVIGYQQRAPITRDGARPGDQIVVSGTLGDAAAGLEFAKSATHSDTVTHWLKQRFLRPTPRVSLGQHLSGIATAAIDVSDGLAADIGHVATASCCRAVIDATRLPLSASLLALFDEDRARRFALVGGDDYELCFTVPADYDVAQLAECTVIGYCEAGDGVQVLDAPAGFVAEESGYQHFE